VQNQWATAGKMPLAASMAVSTKKKAPRKGRAEVE
jgi:hypothetical protein